jgi:uncharacterized membrane protein
MIDSHKRSVAKAISWRLGGTLATMLIVFIFTRKVTVTVGVGFFDLIAKMVIYYLHERVWEKIKWGKVKHPLEELAVKKELEPEDLEKVKQQLKNMGYID